MAQQKHQQEDISVEDVNVTRQVYVPASVLDQLRSQGDFAKRVKALLMAVFTMDEIINNNTMGSDGLGQLDASRLATRRHDTWGTCEPTWCGIHEESPLNYKCALPQDQVGEGGKVGRNRVYRAISGLLTYGPRRGPPGTYYIDDQDLLDIVRDTYPSGEEVNWMLTNQDNRPTKEVGVEDLFEMLEILVFRIVIENTWLWDDAAQCFNELEYSNLAPGHVLHSVVAARTTRTLAMAAPVPVLRGDVTLVGGSLMEVWKKEDEDAAAEREEYREEWAMFEEDMAYLAHLERIMDAEDCSEDEVEEARRLYDQHLQRFGLYGKRYICPVVTDARCCASLESSVVSKDDLQASAELIVSQDRCFASTHVLYVEESLDRTNTVKNVPRFRCIKRKDYTEQRRPYTKTDNVVGNRIVDMGKMEELVNLKLEQKIGFGCKEALRCTTCGYKTTPAELVQRADTRRPGARGPLAVKLNIQAVTPGAKDRPASCAFLCFDCVSQLRKSSVPKVKGGFGNKRTSAARKTPSKSPGPSKRRRRTAASSYILADAVRAMDRRQYLKAFRTILNHDAAMRDCALV
ncbi:hypothetical protein Bbelb_351170 [Branchiostoma belcheri]|nr:hypothetical protein Bbelb_351170 [Branchiostoma belcheri]